RHLEKSTRSNDLPAPATHRAGDRARAGRGAAAAARVASIELAHFDFFFHAEGRFLERDLHIVAQIASTLAAIAPDLAAAEERLENSAAAARAENLAENIERVVETTSAADPSMRKRRVAVAIVSGAF